LLKQLNLKTMKTRLFGFLVVLMSMSMSGQNGTIRFTLESKEILNGDAFCPGGSRGAYFDLTLSNRIIRNVLANNNLNSNDFTLTNYSLDDFSPSGPLEPLNNYRSCGGVIVDVRIENINDPQIYYSGKLKLIVTRPKPIYYYRQIAGGSGNYFYTQNYNAIGNGSIAGMSYVGVAFNANYDIVPGTIPIYRYYNPAVVNHFYTKTRLVNPVGTYGLNYEGIEFYAYNYQASGTIPVYRYYSPSLQNHFYTTNFSIYGSGGSGYNYEGIEFYAFPANANVSKNDNNNDIKDNPVNVKTETDSINTNNFTVFPNPTTGLITIKNDSKTIDSVTVNNLFGEEIQTNKTGGSNTVLDISNLPKGIYLVKVKSQGEEKVMRVIKE
jgi:Secretion system C-terminal sorting domain/Repeat of unknown function (DUF5648)